MSIHRFGEKDKGGLITALDTTGDEDEDVTKEVPILVALEIGRRRLVGKLDGIEVRRQRLVRHPSPQNDGGFDETPKELHGYGVAVMSFGESFRLQ